MEHFLCLGDMEKWQTDWIERNGPRLYRLTDVSQKVLNKLCSVNLLDTDDVEELVRISKQEKDGVAVQKSELYGKLIRQKCYDEVIEVLLECKLSGAANLLKEGREAHEKLQNDHSNKSSDGNKALLFGKIPAELSYYIPRSIQTTFVVSKEVIFQSNDILLFTGIKPHELSSYPGKRSSIDKSGSQVRQMSLSVSHVLLETKDHFKKICELAEKKKAVHWLHHENGRFIWAKSGNGDMSTIRRATEGMADENELFSETNFLAHMDKRAKDYGNSPVVIADTPGMGKSALLKNFGRQIVRNSEGKKVVIFLVFSELINLLKKTKKCANLSISQLEDALVQLVTEQSEGTDLKNFIHHSSAQAGIKTELMLDGYDEISAGDLPLAKDIFALVQHFYPSFRIWVATRPHLLHELEDQLHVSGHTILPFQVSDQEQFLISFWHSKTCKNQTCEFQTTTTCSEVDLSLVKKVAKHCLKILTTNCSKNSNEADICGVPLQCLMLAEVFQEDCLNFVNRENWTSDEEPTLSVKIASIKDLYEALIDLKLTKYADRYYAKELRPKRRAQLLNQHIYLGLQLLFPNHAKLFLEKLRVGKEDCPDSVLKVEILNVGILESPGGGDKLPHQPPRFIHRTIAEFLVALFIAEELCPSPKERKKSVWWQKVLDDVKKKSRNTVQNCQPQCPLLSVLLSEEVFKTKALNMEFKNWAVWHTHLQFRSFLHHVIVFFLDSLLEGRNPVLDLAAPSSEFIVAASIYHDFFNIFKMLVSSDETLPPNRQLPLGDIFLVGVKQLSLNFLKVLFDHFGESWETEAGKSSSLTSQTSNLLHCAVDFREYSILDYLLTRDGFRKLIDDFDPSIEDLLHPLVKHTHNSPEWLLAEKIAILERLVHLQPRFLQGTAFRRNRATPFSQVRVHVELTLKMIELGVTPLTLDGDNVTVLHNCELLTGDEYHRVVASLSEKKILDKLVNVATVGLGRVALHQVAQFVRQPAKLTLECLLSHGANFAKTDKAGKNCLHFAAENGNVGAGRVLLEFDQVREIVNEKDKTGRTPLDILMTSRISNVEGLASLLMENGGKLSRDSVFHETIFKADTHLDQVHFLLGVYRIDVNVRDEYGNTPLHTLLKTLERGGDGNKLVEAVRVLLEMGADVKLRNGENLTPLEILIRETPEASKGCWLEALLLMEEYGAFIDAPEMVERAILFAMKGTSWPLYNKLARLADKLSRGGEATQFQTPSLEECALKGWTIGIRHLLEKGGTVDVRRSNERGETILHLYMSSKNPTAEVVELLLAKGADVSALDLNGDTPLERGMRTSPVVSIEILQLFVFHGAAKLGCPEVANKILFQLLQRRKGEDAEEVVRFVEKLVSEGGDVHAIDEEGSGLLHYAAMNGCICMVRFLVAKEGINVNVRNEQGMTPMHCALKGCVDGDDVLPCVNLLVELGADLEAVDNRNNTMLHFAAKYQSKEVLNYFLEAALFDPLFANDEFLLEVTRCGTLENMKELYLKLEGRRLQDVGRNSTNPDECSILHVAVKEGNYNLVEYLLASKLFVLSPLSEEERLRFGNLLQVCVQGTYEPQEGPLTPLSGTIEFQKHKMRFRIIWALVAANRELLNSRDALGRTCLHVDNVAVILLQVLIENGADVNSKDDGSGSTVIDIAEKYMNDVDFKRFCELVRN